MSNWKQRLMGGPAEGESHENFVRRLARSRIPGYVKPVLPSVVELYARVAALEQRVAQLESR